MKTIISASRRTDIPAFYLRQFMEDIRRGETEVGNPFYPAQKRRVNLSPDAVAWIVFWSRNYSKFLRMHDFFAAYNLFFHFTILPQSKLEKAAIPIHLALKQLERLTALYGPERIIWRYDPLVFWQENGELHTNYNQAQFTLLCKEAGAMGIRRCYTSFAHTYAKFIKRFSQRFPGERPENLQLADQLKIIARMQEIASGFGLALYSCCNDSLLQIQGINKGHCIDGHLLNRLVPAERVSHAKTPTREDCGCTKSVDIGDYRRQPCPFGCIYCYANPLWK